MIIIVLGFFASPVPAEETDDVTVIDPYEGFPCRNMCEFDLATAGWTFPVYYWLYGEKEGDRDAIKLDTMNLDVKGKQVEIDIYTNQEGVLIVFIPSGLLESKTKDDTDAPFQVFSDGNELDYEISDESWHTDDTIVSRVVTEIGGFQWQSVTPEKGRLLKIPIAKDTQRIEIFGTKVSALFESGSPAGSSYECQSITNACIHSLTVSGNPTATAFDITYAITDLTRSEMTYSSPPATIAEVYLTTNKYMPLKELVIGMETSREGSLSLILPNTLIRSEQPSNVGGSTNVTIYKDFKVYYESCYDCIIPHETIIGKDKRMLTFELGNGTREVTISAEWILGQPDYKPWEPDDCERDACTYMVQEGDKTYPIYYRLKSLRDINAGDNPRIKSMHLDLNKKSLVVQLNATHRGLASLELYLPDQVIVSFDKEGKNHRPYMVLVDGRQGTEWKGLSLETGTIDGNILDGGGYGIYTISEGDHREMRGIEVMFYGGTERIEVIGTWVVPEFGSPLLALATAAAILAAVFRVSISRPRKEA